MGSLNDYLMETAINVAKDGSLPWESFRGKTIVVTGATGLVCSQLVRVFLARNNSFSLGSKLFLPVRNIEKAKAMFNGYSGIKFIKWELGLPLEGIDEADYFVHGASPTASNVFAKNPATVAWLIASGGEETLRKSLKLNVQKYLFLSSMEVYGEVSGLASEDNLGKLNTMSPRSCYPEAKRFVECLCASFNEEHNFPAISLRLAQTLGQGFLDGDNRVCVDFARKIKKGEDLVLLTDGSKSNPYLSVNDAIRAIMYALAFGEGGQAYNAANEDTFCSIREMAEQLLSSYKNSNSVLTIEPDPEKAIKFAKSSILNLDSSKLKALGWKPQNGMSEMFTAIFNSLED